MITIAWLKVYKYDLLHYLDLYLAGCSCEVHGNLQLYFVQLKKKWKWKSGSYKLRKMKVTFHSPRNGITPTQLANI